ncbi:protein E6-like [Benincasa hispida]|uniref:protein E6-like n=1 Tax=Benincasa hispida TaxID=102211 RepID=UPI0019002D86|nr:protein E6-like [Benincasa hispida]
MASSPKLLTSILLLSLLLIQIHARESKYFFSKVPNNNVDNFDAKETQLPNNKIDPLTNPEKTTTTPQDQEPNFIPQTQDNSYGLYGHESGQLPPNSDNKFSGGGRPFTTTTTTYDNNNYYRNDAVPNNKPESEEYYNYNNNDYNEYFENSKSKPYENSFYYNKDLYDNGQQSFQNTRLSQDDYTTPLYDQGKYDNFYSNNNGRGSSNNNDNGNNVVRQGMSDTRFMENGKYYYDLNREPHHYSRSRGYFGNNNNNNPNTYEYGNSMGRYQNQNDEAEFQEEPNEFVP